MYEYRARARRQRVASPRPGEHLLIRTSAQEDISSLTLESHLLTDPGETGPHSPAAAGSGREHVLTHTSDVTHTRATGP